MYTCTSTWFQFLENTSIYGLHIIHGGLDLISTPARYMCKGLYMICMYLDLISWIVYDLQLIYLDLFSFVFLEGIQAFTREEYLSASTNPIQHLIVELLARATMAHSGNLTSIPLLRIVHWQFRACFEVQLPNRQMRMEHYIGMMYLMTAKCWMTRRFVQVHLMSWQTVSSKYQKCGSWNQKFGSGECKHFLSLC